MGIIGDMIREVRDTVEGVYEECGFDDLRSELYDIINALKGK